MSYNYLSSKPGIIAGMYCHSKKDYVHMYVSIIQLFPGFESRERTYRNFPEALLHWKVALEVVSAKAILMHFFISICILSPFLLACMVVHIGSACV